MIGLEQKWYFHSILKNADLNVDLTPLELGVRVHECTSLNILFRKEYRHSLKLGIPCPSQKPINEVSKLCYFSMQPCISFYFFAFFFRSNFFSLGPALALLRKYNFEGIF